MSDNIGRPDREVSAEELAAFHVAVWRATYRDLAPAEAYARLDEALRLPQWQAVLAHPAHWLRVLREGGDLIGLIHTAPGAGEIMGGCGEICHLYIRPDQQGRGLGQQLLQEALGALRLAGHRRAALAVVAQNHSARAFYRRCGGREDLAFTDPGPLWRSDNLRVVWDLA
ncbi:GNAT family N-acetyltransferase [Falsigemmobacter faecalis]|nr:GNAT family N-acetyltransferase [Falsigemmobacter faecalis]